MWGNGRKWLWHFLRCIVGVGCFALFWNIMSFATAIPMAELLGKPLMYPVNDFTPVHMLKTADASRTVQTQVDDSAKYNAANVAVVADQCLNPMPAVSAAPVAPVSTTSSVEMFRQYLSSVGMHPDRIPRPKFNPDQVEITRCSAGKSIVRSLKQKRTAPENYKVSEIDEDVVLDAVAFSSGPSDVPAEGKQSSR